MYLVATFLSFQENQSEVVNSFKERWWSKDPSKIFSTYLQCKTVSKESVDNSTTVQKEENR